MVAEEIGDEHGLAERGQGVHAVQEVLVINGVAHLQLAQGHFKHGHGLLALQHGLPQEAVVGAVHHVEHGIGEGTETAALEQHGFLVKELAGDHGLAIGGEHGGFGEPLLDELQGHEAVVHAHKGGAGKFDHVHFHALAGEAVEQRADELFGLGMLVEGGVDEVHADDAHGLLLARGFPVQHPHMDDDGGRFAAGDGLELDAQPAVAFLLAGLGHGLGGDGIGKGEKGAAVAPGGIEALEEQVEFQIQHGTEPAAADVACRRAVDGVAHGHVIGGDGFGHRAGSFADVEEPAGHLLAGADFGKGSVLLGVQIDLERLLTGVEFFFAHFSSRRKYTKKGGCPTR